MGLIDKALSGKRSDTEKKLLSQIKDPEQRAMQELQMEMQDQALVATVVTNIMKMIHDRMMAVANNLKG